MRGCGIAACVLGASLVVSIAGAAIAEPVPAPFVTPQRDVDVTYWIAGPDKGLDPGKPAIATQRMRWSASLWRQRLDPPGSAVMITDYRSRTLLVIEPAARDAPSGTGPVAVLLPAPASGVQPSGVRATGSYRRAGEQTIAGVSCTEWRMPDDSGTESVVCFTADGVMLRARHGDHTLIEAARISYATQDPALFSAPPGTTIRTPPAR